MWQPRVVAAILNYDRPDLAEAMINQLGREIAVVNNGGEAPLPRAYLQINVPSNRYFSGGWNYAMELLARCYDYVWMLNDDVLEVELAMLPVLVQAMPPGSAAITPAFNSPHSEFHRHGQVPRQVTWVDWTCPVVSCQAWREVGPFDESFVGYGADLDWCRRARGLGYTFYVHDGFRVRHIGSQTALAFGLQGVQGNVAEMNRLLAAKWGVTDWSQMK